MPTEKMHEDEIHTDAELVRRLLSAQFPQWAEFAIERVGSAGTDNALYRLGDALVARLPRLDWGIEDPEEENTRWLPTLARLLPVVIPVRLAKGAPGEGYVCEWGVYSWLQGETATVDAVANSDSVVKDVARFLRALQQVEPTGVAPASRGEPLATRDDATRDAVAALQALVETDAATAAWEDALRSPTWREPDVWVHADLLPGNLLLQDGRLTGVIDWDGAGMGDPACDLIVAWALFSVQERQALRAELGVDQPTWARGRGWALSIGAIALPYYKETNPVLAATARRLIDEVLADHESAARD
jgi:aminoglycoside phosphotransferase (APT) family kinase protein